MSACDNCPGAEETFTKLCEECTDDDNDRVDKLVAERAEAINLLESALQVIEGRVGLHTATGKKITAFLNRVAPP